MKRLTASILSLVYLLASVGVMVNVHYCGDRVVDVELYSVAECCCGADQEEDNCCHEESHTFQLEDEQTFSSSAIELNPIQQAMLVQLFEFVGTGDSNQHTDPLEIGEDPPPDGPPLYRLHCSSQHYG